MTRPNMMHPANMNMRIQDHRPQPLLKNSHNQKEFQEKIEEPTEVKQEYKTETEHISNSNEPTRKSEPVINVQPIMPKKVISCSPTNMKPSKKDDHDEEEHKKEENGNNPDEEEEDLFGGPAGEDKPGPTNQATEEIDDSKNNKFRNLPIGKPDPLIEYPPLDSEDSDGNYFFFKMMSR
jgi:hypothetical protein